MSVATEIQRLQTAKADIKSAIENKGVTVGDGTIDTYAEKIGKISGGDDYYDTFWDIYQQNGERRRYSYAFAGEGWTTETLKPKYDIIVGFSEYLFANNAVTDLKGHFESLGIVFDTSTATALPYISSYSNTKILPDIDVSSMTKLSNILRNASSVKTVTIKGINSNHTFDSTFSGALSLVDLILIGTIGKNISLVNSPNLSDTSIQNIIDCLADLTGSTAQTLTLHATVGGKLTDKQKATITAKNWTLVY